MAKMYDLYTLACRSYEFFDAADGFEEAFDECLAVKGLDLILQRVRVTDVERRWIGRLHESRVLDAFDWRVAWVNPDGFSVGPRAYKGTGVAVIEDEYYDFQDYYPEHERPVYCAVTRYWSHTCFSENRYECCVRGLSAREVLGIFNGMLSKGGVRDPIENYWFRDAYLPCHLVDGVPESSEHASVRNRQSIQGSTFAVWPRHYLSVPNWEDVLHQKERCLRAKGKRPLGPLEW